MEIIIFYKFVIWSIIIQLSTTTEHEKNIYSEVTDSRQVEGQNFALFQDISNPTISRSKRQLFYGFEPYYYERYRQPPYSFPLPIIVGGGGFQIGRGFGYGERGFWGRSFGGRSARGQSVGRIGGRGFGGRGVGGRGIGGGRGGRG